MIDLRANRDLIDPDFSGYKLDLTSIPVHEKHLESGVDIVQAGEMQYSYAHATIFSLHNHLHYNPHMPDQAYYVSETWNVVEISIGSHNRVQSIVNVLEIPRSRPRMAGDFPISISFANAEKAVINDGAGNFHVAAMKKEKWLIIYSGNDVPECSIVSSALQHDDKLFILTRSIEEPHFHAVLDVLVLGENWQTLIKKKLQVPGVLYFTSLQSPSSILIISQVTPKNVSKSGHSDGDCLYKWSQTTADVTVIVDAADARSSDVTVDYENGRIRLLVQNREIVSGELFRRVREPAWSLENGKLEVVLLKEEEDVPWREFVLGDVRGVQVQTYQEQEPEDVPYNTEELEEVDAVAPATLFRFRIDTDVISQEADISQAQYLFSTVLNPTQPPALCLKSPIDGCIWQFEEDADLNLKPNHVGTFSAFGYVQASKTQRKFMSAPANLSYAAICDAFRHIYIFRQPGPVSGTLKNRTSGERVKAVARQHLVNLESSEEVLGMRTSNSHLMILTKTKFFLVVINA